MNIKRVKLRISYSFWEDSRKTLRSRFFMGDFWYFSFHVIVLFQLNLNNNTKQKMSCCILPMNISYIQYLLIGTHFLYK